jgi:hypothetical protein
MTMSRKMTTTIAAAAMAAVLAIGAYAIGGGNSAGATTAQNASAQQPGGALNGQPPGARGHRGPGMGTPVTGATATKVGNAALAQYPGRIEHIEKLANGTYVAHVLPTSGGEIHVLVSKTFQVTGTQQRPTGPPPGGTVQQGTPPT